MIKEMKSKALVLMEKTAKHKDKIILASTAAGTVFLAIYAGKKTVARDRAELRRELSNGNVVVHINDKDYFTFSLMVDEDRITK